MAYRPYLLNPEVERVRLSLGPRSPTASTDETLEPAEDAKHSNLVGSRTRDLLKQMPNSKRP